MSQEFDLDDFEKLLKTQTDKHRMYPDDVVWRNINNRLHGQRRWPALTFGAILTVAVLTAGFIFLHPKKDLFNHPEFLVGNEQNKVPAINRNKHISQNNKFAQGLKPTDEKSVIYSLNNLASQSDDYTISETEGGFYMPTNSSVIVSLNEPVDVQIQSKNVSTDKPVLSKLDNSNIKTVAVNSADKQLLESFLAQQHPPTIEDTIVDKEEIVQSKEKDTSTKADDIIKNVAAKSVKKEKEKIENPWEMSFYVTPSASYRTLSLDQSYDLHYPYNPALTGNPRNDVNNYVNQHPAVGFEAGSSLSYAFSKKFRLKAGLQFNYRQYNFGAYLTPTQQASLLMNRGSYADSMITFSNISTQGVNAINITNYYYQLSMPIGFEYTAIQGKKVDISFGATLQPTYQFNKNMYMVTSDYKAYTLEPSLARRWNVNTGIELLARFKAAGLQWQVGPQLRYQMLPTQINNYIIHEHLVDYGLKIGLVKQLK